MEPLAWAVLAIALILSCVCVGLTYRIATSVDGKARMRLVDQFEAHWEALQTTLREIRRERSEESEEFTGFLERMSKERKQAQAGAARAARGEKSVPEQTAKALHQMNPWELRQEHARRKAEGSL